MASKSFFKVKANITRPTQKQIELVRVRALQDVRHSRKGEKLDAKSVEALLRIVSGRYSNLHRALESEYRRVDNKLDMKFAQGSREARKQLIKLKPAIEQLNLISKKTISDDADSNNTPKGSSASVDFDSLMSRFNDVTKKRDK